MCAGSDVDDDDDASERDDDELEAGQGDGAEGVRKMTPDGKVVFAGVCPGVADALAPVPAPAPAPAVEAPKAKAPKARQQSEAAASLA